MTRSDTLVVAGTFRASSSVARLGALVADAVARDGGTAETCTLADLDLPWCDGTPDQHGEPAVARWHTRIAEAAVHVWVTPEWHGSIPGGLKNAADLLGKDAFGGRPLGIVAVGGDGPAPDAIAHLRVVAGHLGAGAVLATGLTASEIPSDGEVPTGITELVDGLLATR